MRTAWLLTVSSGGLFRGRGCILLGGTYFQRMLHTSYGGVSNCNQDGCTPRCNPDGCTPPWVHPLDVAQMDALLDATEMDAPPPPRRLIRVTDACENSTFPIWAVEMVIFIY